MGTGLGKIIEYSPLWLCNAISFLWFICLCAFACKIVKLMGGLELFHQDNVYLFVDMRTFWASVRLVHPITWFKPQWQIVLPLTVPRLKTREFSFSLIVCGVLFEINVLLTHALFPSLLFRYMGRLCF